MYLHEVKIGDIVTFKQKGGKSLKGKVIHRHDGKDRPHLANYVNIQPEDKSAYPKTIHVSQIKPFITEDVSMEHISENIDILVNSIQTDSGVDAIDAFNMAMQEKINAVLEVAKETVASSMFNTEECEDCNEEFEGLDEKLSGKQYKLDANHNGKLESDDFKMLRHEKESAQGEKKMAKYRKMTKEEVESLDELSKKTYADYINKAHYQSQNAARRSTHHALQAGGEGKDAPHQRAETKKHAAWRDYWAKIGDKRDAGINKALNRLTKEEVESLDELSKKTYGSYIKKASVNAFGHHADAVNAEHEQSRQDRIHRDTEGVMATSGVKRTAGDEQKRKDRIQGRLAGLESHKYDATPVTGSGDAMHHLMKGIKRLKGIATATNKLTKEEVESLDELKQSTYQSYHDKALTQKGRGKGLYAATKILKKHKETEAAKMASAKAEYHQGETQGLNTKKGIKQASRKVFKNTQVVHDPNTGETRFHGDQYENFSLEEMMTRKHFQQVADVIKSHEDPMKRHELAHHHSEIFTKSNPRFDRNRFFAAANASHEKPMKEDYEQIDEYKRGLWRPQENGAKPNGVAYAPGRGPKKKKNTDSKVNLEKPSSKRRPAGTIKPKAPARKTDAEIDLAARIFADKAKKDLNNSYEMDGSDVIAETGRQALRAEEYVNEVVNKSTPTSDVIDDFVNSTNPKFAGKSKKERIRMALGAKYSMMRKEDMELDELTQQTYFNAADKRHDQANAVGNLGHYGIAPQKKLQDKAYKLNAWGRQSERDKEIRNIKKSLSPATKRAVGVREDMEQIDERSIAKKTAYLKSLRQRILANKGK